MHSKALFTLLLSSGVGFTSGFAPISSHHETATSLRMSNTAGDVEGEGPDIMNRRNAVIKTASIAGIISAFPYAAMAEEEETAAPTPSTASEIKAIGTDALKPISIIGAGGKVGSICTDLLNKKGLYTRAITRSGRKILGDDSQYVSYASGDVTNYEVIKKAIDGSSGVIFAASASGKKKGGDPEHVDYLGLYNTAKACLECGVPKLVVVSAGSITRPDFVGFKATNLFVKYLYGEKIMDYKIAGEAVMRDLYANSNQNECSYSVVRPGGLSDAQAEGPGLIHVSQGDVYSAEITRQDVAEVSVAALLKGKATDFTTFELNMKKGLNKVSKDLETPGPALVHDGAKSYDALLDGLLTDEAMKSSYPQYMNNFRGDKIKPISEVA